VCSVYPNISNARGPRTKDQTEVRGSVVYSIISNDIGPGTKDQTEVESRWRVCAVNSIISNASGPRTKDQTEVESECSLQHHFKCQRTKDQGPD
jgi:hypothetical protein